MKTYIEIRCLAYLKTPQVRWTICNDVGGSFTNSGSYRTLKALGKAFRAQHSESRWLDCPVRVVTVEGFDINDKPVETSYMSYFAKVFGFGVV